MVIKYKYRTDSILEIDFFGTYSDEKFAHFLSEIEEEGYNRSCNQMLLNFDHIENQIPDNILDIFIDVLSRNFIYAVCSETIEPTDYNFYIRSNINNKGNLILNTFKTYDDAILWLKSILGK